ncbi:MAG: ABC transporter substrate-binding protein, partial [Sphaerochaeta sp.]
MKKVITVLLKTVVTPPSKRVITGKTQVVITERPKKVIDISKPITIEWWHALEQQYWPLVDEIVGDFNATHPLITVEAKYI